MREVNEMNFAQGDTVMLKSGGPAMTVEDSNWNGANEVRVVWFGESNVLRYEVFTPALLKKTKAVVSPPRRRSSR